MCVCVPSLKQGIAIYEKSYSRFWGGGVFPPRKKTKNELFPLQLRPKSLQFFLLVCVYRIQFVLDDLLSPSVKAIFFSLLMTWKCKMRIFYGLTERLMNIHKQTLYTVFFNLYLSTFFFPFSEIFKKNSVIIWKYKNCNKLPARIFFFFSLYFKNYLITKRNTVAQPLYF